MGVALLYADPLGSGSHTGIVYSRATPGGWPAAACRRPGVACPGAPLACPGAGGGMNGSLLPVAWAWWLHMLNLSLHSSVCPGCISITSILLRPRAVSARRNAAGVARERGVRP